MVERFILPQWFTGAAQPGIDVARRDALDGPGNFGEWDVGVEKHVDMIGHDDISVQKEAAKLGAAKNRVLGIIGELAVGEPKGPRLTESS